MVRTVTLEQLLEYQLYHLENKVPACAQRDWSPQLFGPQAALAARLSRERGHVVRMCKIMDLEGLGRKHLHPGVRSRSARTLADRLQ